MRDVPEIVKILREEEKVMFKNNIKKNLNYLDQIDEIYDDLWFHQWRFL